MLLRNFIMRLRRYLVNHCFNLRKVGITLVILLLTGIITNQILSLSPYTSSILNSDTAHLTKDELVSYENQKTIKYVRAKVLSVKENSSDLGGHQQALRVQILDGPDAGNIVSTDRNINFGDANYKRLPVGSQVLLTIDSKNGNKYLFLDRYRIPGAVTLFLILIALVVVIARWRGITSVAGLIVSISILFVFVIPRIIGGHDAYLTCIEGAFIIAAASIYIAHGFNKRTTVAFIGAVGTLSLTIVVTSFSGYLAGLSGFLGEQSLGIQYASQHISLAGLLFGGIVIASLGVLNDITIGQAASVDEIYKANIKQSTAELYRKGMSVGREHIAALVNTLALAYVGVALPSVVVTALYDHSPILVILNDETVMQEIVRTGVVSISLLLAVPVTTILAAYLIPKWNEDGNKTFKKWSKKLLS